MATKRVSFRGDSLDALRAFPETARRDAGFQLDKVEKGHDPDDWKSMAIIGAGAREIRIWDEAGTFRVIYIARMVDAIYVLHCFQKKTEETSQRDIALAQRRYRDLMQEYRR